MCLCDLIDIDPSRRKRFAIRENFTHMLLAVREFDTTNSFTPAKAAEANPCAESVEAGTFYSQGVTA